MADENTIPTEDAAATVSGDSIAEFLSDEPTAEDTPTPVEESTVETPTEVSTETPEESTPETAEEPVVETTPEVETPTEQSELELLKAQNAKLMEVIGKLPGVQTPQSTSTSDIDDTTPTIEKLLEDTNFDEIMESKENFTKFFKDAMNSVKNETIRTFQQVLPQYATPIISNQITMKEVADNFYSQNKDLAVVKPYVASIANEVSKENPEFTVAQVLEESAKRARESLGIVAIPSTSQASSSSPREKSKPTLPGGTTTGSRPTGGGERDEIMELLED